MARRIKSSTTSLTATGTLVATLDLGDKAPIKVRAYLTAADVTTGGTAQLQASFDGTSWVSAGSATVNADGNWTITADGPGRHWRLQVTARTDGTFSAGAIEVLC
jgi:hypothetical protein